jgi:uncharacterized coiled-coil DUF342 family protein
MDKIQEIIDLLQGKMDECDELIAEIAQLRYDLEDIITAVNSKIQKPCA